MIEFRTLAPEVSESGQWQLEYRDVGSFVWTVETCGSHGEALRKAMDNGYVKMEDRDGQ